MNELAREELVKAELDGIHKITHRLHARLEDGRIGHCALGVLHRAYHHYDDKESIQCMHKMMNGKKCGYTDYYEICKNYTIPISLYSSSFTPTKEINGDMICPIPEIKILSFTAGGNEVSIVLPLFWINDQTDLSFLDIARKVVNGLSNIMCDYRTPEAVKVSPEVVEVFYTEN